MSVRCPECDRTFKTAQALGGHKAFHRPSPVQVGDHADGGWRERAACRGLGPDLFFTERGTATKDAKAVCEGCPVREDCLEFALDTVQLFGVWGGKSEAERRRLRRGRGRRRAS